MSKDISAYWLFDIFEICKLYNKLWSHSVTRVQFIVLCYVKWVYPTTVKFSIQKTVGLSDYCFHIFSLRCFEIFGIDKDMVCIYFSNDKWVHNRVYFLYLDITDSIQCKNRM